MRKILLVVPLLLLAGISAAQVVRYVVVDGNKVTNVILADSKFAAMISGQHTAVVTEDNASKIPGVSGGSLLSISAFQVAVSTP